MQFAQSGLVNILANRCGRDQVLDIYRLVEGEFNPTTVATDLLRSNLSTLQLFFTFVVFVRASVPLGPKCPSFRAFKLVRNSETLSCWYHAPSNTPKVLDGRDRLHKHGRFEGPQ